MARPKNSPEKIENMRNKMMDAVVDLLDEVSPDKVSIRMIAEKIGVSHMVFYTYFKDRAEIISALIKREQDRTSEHFKGLVEKTERMPVKQVLSEFMRGYSREGHKHPKIFRMYWLAVSGPDNNMLQTRKHLEKIYEKMAELLEMGMQKGEFKRRDPQLVAFLVMAMINAPIITHFCGNKPDQISCDEVLRENIEAVISYLSQ
jgi:AcrR family transcriptional regulator